MVTIVDAKNAKKFICEQCDFECCKLSNYNKHLNTAKHKMVTNGDKKMPSDITKHICSCGKEFKYRQGLSRHKQNCNGIQINTVSATVTTPVPSTNNDLINVIVKQQEETTELKKLLIEQQDTHFKQMKEQQQQIQEQQEQHNKQIQELIPQLNQITNINNNNTNCNNKFNLNFFLNEQCKDAISIQHFIENLNIGIRELEHMGDVGYVKGTTLSRWCSSPSQGAWSRETRSRGPRAGTTGSSSISTDPEPTCSHTPSMFTSVTSKTNYSRSGHRSSRTRVFL